MMPLEFAIMLGLALICGIVAGRLWDRSAVDRERAHGIELAKLVVELLKRRGVDPEPQEEPAAPPSAEDDERVVLGSGRRRHRLMQRELLSRRLARAGFTNVVAPPKPKPESE